MTYLLPENASSFPNLFRSINTMVGNDSLAIMFLIIIFVITYIISSTRMDAIRCIAYSSWITAISSVLIRAIFATSDMIIWPFIFMALMSVLLMKKRYD